MITAVPPWGEVLHAIGCNNCFRGFLRMIDLLGKIEKSRLRHCQAESAVLSSLPKRSIFSEQSGILVKPFFTMISFLCFTLR